MATGSKFLPVAIDPRKFIRNTRLVDARTVGPIAARINHALVYRRKNVFTKCIDIAKMVDGTYTAPFDRTIWRTYFRTGDGESGKLFLVFEHLLFASGLGALDKPNVRWEVKPAGGSSATTFRVLDSRSDDPEPSGIRRRRLIWQVSPDTEYELTCTAGGGARPFACTIYETHESTFDPASVSSSAAVDPQSYGVGTPVTDDDQRDLLTASYALYRHHGAHLISWCVDWDPDAGGGTAPQRSTASYANAFDQTVTIVTSTTPGFYVRANDHHPLHSSATDGVPGKLAVYAKDAGSGSGVVRLQDSSGTVASLTGFSTAGEWKTVTATFNGDSSHKVDLQLQGDGSNTLTIYAVSAWAYTENGTGDFDDGAFGAGFD